MSTMVQDIRFALRTLRRTPGFTFIAVLTLALGIGANTAIFSVFYGVLVRPLSYHDPDQLVQLAYSYQNYRGSMGVTYAEYQFLEQRSTPFASITGTTNVGFNLSNGSEAFRAAGLRVSRGYFEVLGVQPKLGRAFTAEEDVAGGPSSVILSHGLWQRSFGGDPGIVGRVIALDGKPTTVVGVMPADFRSLPAVEAWSTLAQVGQSIGSGQNLELIARLKSGVTLDQAQAQMTGTFAGFRDEFKDILAKDALFDLLPYRQLIVSDVTSQIRVLVGSIMFVLLIACANVASLLMSRGIGRARELAMRLALGAGRGVLTRQLLTESMVLAMLGGLLGVVFAVWGLQALLAFLPSDVPLSEGIHLDSRALLFTFVLSMVTGLIFGLLPAWQVARVDPQSVLKEGSGRTTSGAAHSRMRDTLVVAEIALSLVLLTGAGLLGRTFANLMRTDPGFEVNKVLSTEIWLTGSRHEVESSVSGFYNELNAKVRAIPGVEAAAVVEAGAPLSRGGNIGVTYGDQRNSIDYRTITPDYFRVLGVPLKEGRLLTDSDNEAAEKVVVVNEAFARKVLKEHGTLGEVIKIGGDGGDHFRVVGVVADVRSYIGFPAPPTVFITSPQTPPGFTRVYSSWFPIHVMVRTSSDPATLGPQVARAIRETDALVPIGNVEPMAQVLSTSLAFQRFLLLLLGGFASLAVILAAVGIYGLMSHRVAQRKHEFGIRMSLGAVPRDVLELVLSRGMRLTAVGVGIGLVGAAGLTRYLESQLYGVKALDISTFATGAIGVGLVSLFACYLPALRATRVDPMIALRSE